LGLIPLLLKVGAMHGTHYETNNPSLICTNATSCGQTAGSNLAVSLCQNRASSMHKTAVSVVGRRLRQ
jgi:hypothetical protein